MNQAIQLAALLGRQVLSPMKNAFVGKDEVIDLLGVCLVARENLFILGPPGTAKSALVQDLARRMQGHVFDYLLTRFTEPNEIFGPFDIRQLRDGNLVTNTEGMLPEATFVFLDELLNANSAILNSLLMVLNERVFRRGRETRPLPTLLVVGASNRTPEDEALGALFDRFLLRVDCGNTPDERLGDVLIAGWKLDHASEPPTRPLTIENIQQLQAAVADVDLQTVRTDYAKLGLQLRQAGIPFSDRRAVKLQRVIAASALLCGRMQTHRSDLWVMRYIWDNIEQQSVVHAIVQGFIDQEEEQNRETMRHPRSLGSRQPDPETLARDLEIISGRANDPAIDDVEKTQLRDRLGILAGQCAWVADKQQRTYLEENISAAWELLS